MAIQKINLGTEPLGEGGDTYRSANTKINENFSNTTHAASRLVGKGAGQIALNEGLYEALHKNLNIPLIGGDAGFDVDELETGTVTRVATRGNINMPPQTFSLSESHIIYTTHEGSGRKVQITRGYNNQPDRMERASDSSGNFGGAAWKPVVRTVLGYATTTATAPNVVLEADGTFRRNASSIKYKDILSKLELNYELYNKAMQTKPIVYRSKADADPENWHFMSFAAEELGEIDPALTQWRTHGVNEETGEWGELEQKEAEGINLNAICAVLHATNIYQDKKLKELEQRLTALEQLIEPEPVEEPVAESK